MDSNILENWTSPFVIQLRGVWCTFFYLPFKQIPVSKQSGSTLVCQVAISVTLGMSGLTSRRCMNTIEWNRGECPNEIVGRSIFDLSQQLPNLSRNQNAHDAVSVPFHGRSTRNSGKMKRNRPPCLYYRQFQCLNEEINEKSPVSVIIKECSHSR